MSQTNKTKADNRFFFNKKKHQGSYPEYLNKCLSKTDSDKAIKEITQWDKYETTKLINLNELAKSYGLESIYYKDESSRFGLGSFKALGGAYGVLMYLHQMISNELKTEIDIDDVRKGKYKELTKSYVVATATDGNHGRAVAYGAKIFGCKCNIYIHSEVSLGRKEAMEDLGANVIRIDGNYDDSLKICIDEAKTNQWQIISDTSYDGYTEYPRYIMAGYTVLADEIIKELNNKPIPTHIFLQAGVGGFAAAMCMLFWNSWGDKNIKYIIVEPNLAPCLIDSMESGKITVFDITEETMMTGLSCGEPSLLAWDILKISGDLFMTINDDQIPALMRQLSKKEGSDPNIEAGECSVSGLIALNAIRDNKDIANKLNLNNESRILLFGTEGATDPDIYRKIIQDE